MSKQPECSERLKCKVVSLIPQSGNRAGQAARDPEVDAAASRRGQRELHVVRSEGLRDDCQSCGNEVAALKAKLAALQKERDFFHSMALLLARESH